MTGRVEHHAGGPATDAPTVVGYRAGQCRNNPNAISHTYAMMSDGELWPMCGYGWNRGDGTAFSIFRGSPGTQGVCIVCARNVAAKRPPVCDGFEHKTRWL
jgi:hypothetical protein